MELGRNRRLVTPVEFLAMVPHIILRYEVEIRTYSVFSTTIRKRFGWVQEDDAESSAPDVITVEESEFVKLRKRNWARLIARVWKDDPEVSSDCGSKIEVLSAFVARLLASHPPWQRERQPRGPPKQLEFFQDEGSQVPTWNPEDENQDPPGDAWMD